MNSSGNYAKKIPPLSPIATVSQPLIAKFITTLKIFSGMKISEDWVGKKIIFDK